LLSDYTATTILGKFQNDAAGRSVERVLEKLSKKKAAEILAVSSCP
jgi:import receptor subunit TOM70